jgi:hypothetical protein
MKLGPLVAAAVLALPALAQTNTIDAARGSVGDAQDRQHAKDSESKPPNAAQAVEDAQQQAQANSDAAKRAFDIASVNLLAAKDYLGGLNDLAQKPTTWDREASIALFNNAQRAVTDAEERIGQLEPMATGSWAKARGPINRARASLVNAQRQLRTFAGSVPTDSGDPASRQLYIKGLWNTVDGASKALDDAAVQMNVDTKLKTP